MKHFARAALRTVLIFAAMSAAAQTTPLTSLSVDDLLKTALNFLDGQTAKRIVNSQFQNEYVDPVLQMRREPFQTAFGCPAGCAGIDHLKVHTGGLQLLRKQSGIGLAAFKHKAVR